MGIPDIPSLRETVISAWLHGQLARFCGGMSNASISKGSGAGDSQGARGAERLSRSTDSPSSDDV